MGCSRSKAAEPDEKPSEYDTKWDETREKFRAAKTGKGSDGMPGDEPGACCGGCGMWFAAKKGAITLKMSGAQFQPTDPGAASPTAAAQMSSRDRQKIQLWLDGITDYTGGEGLSSKGLNRAPSDAHFARPPRDEHRFSVRTIYSQDDEEEFIEAEAAGINNDMWESAKTQRLSDRKNLNKLQLQLRAHQKKAAGEDGPPETKSPPQQELPDAVAPMDVEASGEREPEVQNVS